MINLEHPISKLSNMTDLEKLRVEHWSRVYSAIVNSELGNYTPGELADESLKSFDKRFQPTPCAHIYYHPSTKCAHCGEPMPQAIVDDLKARPLAEDRTPVGGNSDNPDYGAPCIYCGYRGKHHPDCVAAFAKPIEQPVATGPTFLGGADWCRRSHHPKPRDMQTCACLGDDACRLFPGINKFDPVWKRTRI